MRINLNVSFLTAIAIAASSVVLASPAKALTFGWSWQESDGLYDEEGHRHLWVNDSLGDYDAIDVSYNTNQSALSWSSTFTQVGDAQIDGGWLVISDGPNPKQHDKEYSIFYLDASDLNETRITAYAYNGQNNASSWQSNEFLQSWINALNVDDDGAQRTISFDLDVSGINSANISSSWKGTQFTENLGIWFHAGQQTLASYNEIDGRLESFNTRARWFDSGRLDATQDVPEPFALAGLGIIAGSLVTCRQHNAQASTK